MNIAIQVEQLRKSYGEQLVLKGLLPPWNV